MELDIEPQNRPTQTWSGDFFLQRSKVNSMDKDSIFKCQAGTTRHLHFKK